MVMIVMVILARLELSVSRSWDICRDGLECSSSFWDIDLGLGGTRVTLIFLSQNWEFSLSWVIELADLLQADSREFSRFVSWEFSRETERREVEVLADLLYSLSRSVPGVT